MVVVCDLTEGTENKICSMVALLLVLVAVCVVN